MTREPATLDEIDYWDLDMFEFGDPHRAWQEQRRAAKVWWHDRPGGEPFWSVACLDDARTVFGDALTYSSQRNGIVARTTAAMGRPNPGEQHGVQPMIHTDPPRHVKLRKVVSARFTPRAIAQLEEETRTYARQCIAEAVEKRDIDFVTDIAHRTPSFVTFWLLDIPPGRWARLAELEHRTVTSSDPEFTRGADPQQAAAEAGAEITGYFAELVQSRQKALGDDLLSEFLRGQIDGEPLRWQQVVAEAGLLLAGGLDTTRAAASAGGMLPLLQHPDQLAWLQAEPARVAAAVEEFVRWASPVMHEARTAVADATLAGHRVRAGDRVVVWGASCNRDEHHFANSMHYDVRRQPNRHIGFAYGEHFCLGSHLARLILRVEFEELLSTVARFELTGEPARVRSNFVGGLKHLPMRLTPR